MKPTRSVGSFLTKLGMLHLDRVLICEDPVDRGAIGRICKHIGVERSIDVRAANEVCDGLQGRTVCHAIYTDYLKTGTGKISTANRTVEVAVYLDRDLAWLAGECCTHERVATSSGYCIENDIFDAMSIERLIEKLTGLALAIPSLPTGHQWCKVYFGAARHVCLTAFACQVLSIPGTRGFGGSAQYAGSWPPTFDDVSPNKLIIDRTLCARGMDCRAQLDVIESIFSDIETTNGFQRLINGKWFAMPLAEYCVVTVSSVGRSLNISYVQSVLVLCAMEACNWDDDVFNNIVKVLRCLESLSVPDTSADKPKQ